MPTVAIDRMLAQDGVRPGRDR